MATLTLTKNSFINDEKTDSLFYTGPLEAAKKIAVAERIVKEYVNRKGNFVVSLNDECSDGSLSEAEWGAADTNEQAWRFALGAFFGPYDYDEDSIEIDIPVEKADPYVIIQDGCVVNDPVIPVIDLDMLNMPDNFDELFEILENILDINLRFGTSSTLRKIYKNTHATISSEGSDNRRIQLTEYPYPHRVAWQDPNYPDSDSVSTIKELNV